MKVNKSRVGMTVLWILFGLAMTNWAVSAYRTDVAKRELAAENDRKMDLVLQQSQMVKGCYTDFEANKQMGVECTNNLEAIDDVLAKD